MAHGFAGHGGGGHGGGGHRGGGGGRHHGGGGRGFRGGRGWGPGWGWGGGYIYGADTGVYCPDPTNPNDCYIADVGPRLVYAGMGGDAAMPPISGNNAATWSPAAQTPAPPAPSFLDSPAGMVVALAVLLGAGYLIMKDR